MSLISLASLVMLNPRPFLQPNAEERKIIRKIERKMVRRFYLGLFGMLLLIGITITSIIVLS
jgi:hypothetical protein